MRVILAALLIFASPAAGEPLTFDNGRLFVAARVNGVATEALLDSGAEATLVDPKLAARAQLAQGTPQTIRGSGGSVAARIVEGATLEALGMTLRPEAVVVLELSDLSQRLIKRPTEAIIGRELFDAARLTIDIGGGSIAVADPRAVPPGKRLALTGRAGIETIAVRVNGRAVSAEFDLGNGSEVMISRALARQLGLKRTGRKRGGGIGGEVVRELVRLRTLELAGARYRNVIAAVDDQPGAGQLNVGTAILKGFLITTDYRARALWLEPVGRIGR